MLKTLFTCFLLVTLSIYAKQNDLENAIINSDISTLKSLLNDNVNLENLGKYNEKPLRKLIESEEMQELIFNKVNEQAQQSNKPLLFWAIERGLFNLVEFLSIDKEYDLTVIDQNTGFTALHEAINSSQEQIAKFLLIKTGIRLLNIVDSQNRTPIQLAQAMMRDSIIALINERIQTNGRITDRPGVGHKDEMTVQLHKAAFICDTTTIIRLIMNGVFVNARDSEGRTASHIMAERGLYPARMLRENGADINARDKSGKTPLLSGINNGSYFLDFVIKMVEYGAEITARDNNGTNVLHLAAKNKDVELIDYLLADRNFNIDMVDNEGKAAIDYAAEQGHLGVVKYLIMLDAKVDRPLEKKDSNILFWAIRKGYIEAVKELLSYRTCQVNEITDFEKQSALEIASEYGQYEIAAYLIENAASINYVDGYGKQAIHYAASRKNNLKIVKLLIQNGARLNDKDNSNKTPLELAKQHNLTGVANYLETQLKHKNEEKKK